MYMIKSLYEYVYLVMLSLIDYGKVFEIFFILFVEKVEFFQEEVYIILKRFQLIKSIGVCLCKKKIVKKQIFFFLSYFFFNDFFCVYKFQLQVFRDKGFNNIYIFYF